MPALNNRKSRCSCRPETLADDGFRQAARLARSGRTLYCSPAMYRHSKRTRGGGHILTRVPRRYKKVGISRPDGLELLGECLFGHCGRGNRRRPSRIEREVRDYFGELLFRNAVLQRAGKMKFQLLRAIQSNKGGYGNKTAVPLGQAGPLPNVCKQNI